MNHKRNTKSSRKGLFDDASLTKLEAYEKDLELAIADLESFCEGKEEFDMIKIAKALLCCFVKGDYDKRIKELEEKTKLENEKVTKINQELNEINGRITLNEIRNYEQIVIIKNVPLHNEVKDGKETPAQTKAVIEYILHISGVNLNGIKDYYRKTNVNPTRPPKLFIEFSSKQILSIFLRSLHKWKDNLDLKKAIIEKFVPKSLMTKYLQAHKQAFLLRRNEMKTRIIITSKGEILLLSRKSINEKFTKVDFQVDM